MFRNDAAFGIYNLNIKCLQNLKCNKLCLQAAQINELLYTEITYLQPSYAQIQNQCNSPTLMKSSAGIFKASEYCPIAIIKSAVVGNSAKLKTKR